MRTTIDGAGRIVVPKSLREELRLVGGQDLDIVVRDGRLEVTVPATDVRLERRDGVMVAVPDLELPALSASQVRETLEHTRR